jgi:type II secretory ATPase GspE/PulE/Tfp pilus assembly ATPase PilB-like protein
MKGATRGLLRRWTTPVATSQEPAGAQLAMPFAQDAPGWAQFAELSWVHSEKDVPPFVRVYGGSSRREATSRDLPPQRRAQAIALIQNTGSAVVLLSDQVFGPEVASAWSTILRQHGHDIDRWMRAPAAVVDGLYKADLRRLEIRERIEVATTEAPKLLHEMLAEGIRRGASDLDIEVDEARKTTRIRLRIAGQLVVVEDRHDPFGVDLVRAAFEAVPLDERTRNKTPWSPRADLAGLAVFPSVRNARVRLQQMVSVSGLGCAMRLVDYDGLFERYEDLAALGFTEDQSRDILQSLGRTRGIVLFVGGTGSGKTTSLSVAVRHSPRFAHRKWVSIEDPPEIRTPGIFAHPVYSHGTVGGPSDTDGFANALRNVLRFTPDGVIAGEIRDQSTASLALALALSGHVAAGTLHAGDPFVALRHLSGHTLRLDPDAIAEPGVISLVAAMHLVPVLCRWCCHDADQTSPAVVRTAAQLRHAGLRDDSMRQRNDSGCANCSEGVPGYSGRRTCASVVPFDRDASLALGREGSEGVYRIWRERRASSAAECDMTGRTVAEHMLFRVSQGECDPHDFDRMFGGASTASR